MVGYHLQPKLFKSPFLRIPSLFKETGWWPFLERLKRFSKENKVVAAHKQQWWLYQQKEAAFPSRNKFLPLSTLHRAVLQNYHLSTAQQRQLRPHGGWEISGICPFFANIKAPNHFNRCQLILLKTTLGQHIAADLFRASWKTGGVPLWGYLGGVY